MRELNECKTEVFRRSEKRIKERKKMQKRVITGCVSLGLILFLCFGVIPVTMPDGENHAPGVNQNMSPRPNDSDPNSNVNNRPNNGDENYGRPQNEDDMNGGNLVEDEGDKDVNYTAGEESFSFSLTWGAYGISSYDSATGKLVKTTDATNPSDYVTTYILTEAEKQTIRDMIQSLNITEYPDVYDPHEGGLSSDPSMTLILSVKTKTMEKTITAKDIALTYEANNEQGQKFLRVCKAIRDILLETDEWKNLPEYEFYYD